MPRIADHAIAPMLNRIQELIAALAERDATIAELTQALEDERGHNKALQKAFDNKCKLIELLEHRASP